jgi:hypothetical protein
MAIGISLPVTRTARSWPQLWVDRTKAWIELLQKGAALPPMEPWIS